MQYSYNDAAQYCSIWVWDPVKQTKVLAEDVCFNYERPSNVYYTNAQV